MNKIALIFLVLGTAGCGVKGRPMAPLVPTPIGRGEPGYSEKKIDKPPVKNKYNYKLEKMSDENTESSRD